MAWQGESFDDSRDLWNNSSYNGENRVTGREPTTGGATRIADLAPGPNATNIVWSFCTFHYSITMTSNEWGYSCKILYFLLIELFSFIHEHC